jgi:hypothetical protein
MQSQDNHSYNQLKSYAIDRDDLIKWLNLTETTRIKLIKSENDKDIDSLSEESLFNSNFSKSKNKPDILDICSGNLAHINLKQIV